ncbi:DNA-processing protein DprA, partial [Ameyamaea chiangmaiensis]
GIVSGLARGIDAAAHRGALAMREGGVPGVTVAAVAGGLDRVYPPEHADLQAEIGACGVVVTEAPLGTTPQSRHFPGRNRIIAGLSLGCVVVEAALRSGTLITARLALAYDRVLYAVPGSPLDPRARGSNDLLRHGATLVEDGADVLRTLPESLHPALFPGGFAEPDMPWDVSNAEATRQRDVLRALLSFAPMPVDELARRCQFSIPFVLARLTELELAGLCAFAPGGAAVVATPT